jgi:hypothetical protein
MIYKNSKITNIEVMNTSEAVKYYSYWRYRIRYRLKNDMSDKTIYGNIFWLKIIYNVEF